MDCDANDRPQYREGRSRCGSSDGRPSPPREDRPLQAGYATDRALLLALNVSWNF